MRTEIRTKAIVLHEMPIKESDKRLILLTKELGKVTVFVRGARKPNSPFLAASQVFAYSEFLLYEGKRDSQSYQVTSADLIEPFHGLRHDIEQLTYALHLLELSEFICQESEPNHELMKLILKTLAVMERQMMDVRLACHIFELKALSTIGLKPWVENCVICHELPIIAYFSSEEGGLLCQTHRVMDLEAKCISQATLYAMQFVLHTELNKLFSFTLETSVLNEFEGVMEAFLKKTLHKQFKALTFLKGL